jgi:CRP-like cAMP-binding protein
VTTAPETVAFFEDIDPGHRARILDGFRAEEHPAGAVLFEQGQPADRLYLLLSGRVEIRFKPDDGDPLSVTIIDPGGVFGWSAALGRSSYTSGATVVEACRCLSIRGPDLRRICEEHPNTGVILLERLAEVIAQRLSSTHQHVLRLLQRGVRRRGER